MSSRIAAQEMPASEDDPRAVSDTPVAACREAESAHTRRQHEDALPEDMSGNDAVEADLVLIVEDEGSIAEIVSLVLKDEGYTRMLARHGREALLLAHSLRPALIIPDLMMPYIGGAELIATLRAEANSHDSAVPPIILMIAAGAEQAQAAALMQCRTSRSQSTL